MIRNFIFASASLGSQEVVLPQPPPEPPASAFFQTFDHNLSNWNTSGGLGPTTVTGSPTRTTGKEGTAFNCNAQSCGLYYSDSNLTVRTNGLFTMSCDIWVPPEAFAGKYDFAALFCCGTYGGSYGISIGVETGTNNLWIAGISTTSGGVKFDPGARNRWVNVRVQRSVPATVKTYIDNAEVYSRVVTSGVTSGPGGSGAIYVNRSSAKSDGGCSNSKVDNLMFTKAGSL